MPASQDGSALHTCTIPAGTYSETFTLGPGGIHCPSIPVQTITIAENEAITGNEVTTGNGSFGLFDAGTSISLTFDDHSATGQESTKSTDSAGNVLSSCNYDIAVTMR